MMYIRVVIYHSVAKCELRIIWLLSKWYSRYITTDAIYVLWAVALVIVVWCSTALFTPYKKQFHHVDQSSLKQLQEGRGADFCLIPNLHIYQKMWVVVHTMVTRPALAKAYCPIFEKDHKNACIAHVILYGSYSNYVKYNHVRVIKPSIGKI